MYIKVKRMEDGKLLQEIKGMISYFAEQQRIFSEEFYQYHDDAPNLSRYEIRHIFNEQSYDKAFIRLIENYLKELSFINIEYDFGSDKIELSFRVKQLESVINKIVLKHQLDRVNQGAVSVQKCLNDLLGARLVIETKLTYEALRQEVLSLPCIWRPYYRCDGEYEALHVYVKNNNKYFPWELQIWRKCDQVKNERSHAEHVAKRKYISWDDRYKELRERGS